MRLPLILLLASALGAAAANAASPECEAATQQYQELRSRSQMNEAQYATTVEAATMRKLCAETPESTPAPAAAAPGTVTTPASPGSGTPRAQQPARQAPANTTLELASGRPALAPAPPPAAVGR